jgi:hypothetical protein
MKQSLTAILVALVVCVSFYVRAAQSADPGITQTRVLGQVVQTDPSGKRLVVKTDAGSLVAVTLDEKTEFLRVPPGETSLEKAVKTTLAEIVSGDRVYVRGKVSDDRKSVPAQKLIVMPKADIEKKHEQERADWRRRGISGIISALNAQTREITIQARGREGLKPVTIAAPNTIAFRRYAPDSVKFSDAKASSFDELKVGDQLRALGDKSADGSRFTAQQVVSGSFKTVGGTVKSVSADANEIKIEMLGGKQQLTIAVNSDSMLRRIPQQLGMLLAQRGQSGPGAQAPDGPPRQSSSPPAGGSKPGGPPRSEGGGDFQDMLERMPALSLTEIRPGDVIAVSSTVGADPSRLTAITLVAGVDVILAAIQRSGSPSRAVNLSTGLPSGVLDFGIGLP